VEVKVQKPGEARKNGCLEGNAGRNKCWLSVENICAMDSEVSYQSFTTEAQVQSQVSQHGF
jgi:hypothetical protein